jgi:hypothetical protein
MASHQPEASTSLAPEEHLPRDARLMALLLASKVRPRDESYTAQERK